MWTIGSFSGIARRPLHIRGIIIIVVVVTNREKSHTSEHLFWCLIAYMEEDEVSNNEAQTFGGQSCFLCYLSHTSLLTLLSYANSPRASERDERTPQKCTSKCNIVCSVRHRRRRRCRRNLIQWFDVRRRRRRAEKAIPSSWWFIAHKVDLCATPRSADGACFFNRSQSVLRSFYQSCFVLTLSLSSNM